jgi:hypothetical protein
LAAVLLTDDTTIPSQIGGGQELRVKAARALAAIGTTPEEALPTLMAMTQGTNQWARWFASIALWNRDRQNPNLQASVIEGLRSTNRVGVLICLGQLGTNAAPFLPEIRRLLDDPFTSFSAKYALRQVEANSP